jgi:hypothetical protein
MHNHASCEYTRLIAHHPFLSICTGSKYMTKVTGTNHVLRNGDAMEESGSIQSFNTFFHYRSSRIRTEIMESRTLHCRWMHLFALYSFTEQPHGPARTTLVTRALESRLKIMSARGKGEGFCRLLGIFGPCPKQLENPKKTGRACEALQTFLRVASRCVTTSPCDEVLISTLYLMPPSNCKRQANQETKQK